MVSIIKNQLLKHLSRFTKNLSADKINLSTFKGEGELSNLELDEIVLTDLLELPSWLRLTSAWCNRVSFRIQWTKLKSVPIFLSLDEVHVEVETCEELRSMSAQHGLSSYTGPAKYSFINKVIDGMTVVVNTVKVTFKSPAFIASVQMSRILVESKSPSWQHCDLRMTRLKDPERGQLLIFKELEWQTVRIEAKCSKNENLTPLRLLTNTARCRITIKKRISDCFIMGSRLVLILDDLLWVLTDSQLKAALHFVDSLSGLVQKSTEATRTKKAARKLEVLPEYQAQISQQARSKDSGNTLSRIFSRYDVVETSYHFLSQRIDLHLCDDPGDGRSMHPDLKDGGALQISLQQFQVDYYPYHLAIGDRKHWPKYREGASPHGQWLKEALGSFRNSFLDLIDQARPQHTPLGRSNAANEHQGPGDKPVPPQQDAARRAGMAPAGQAGGNPVKNHVLAQLAKLMMSCVILRIQDFALYQVTTCHRKQVPKEFVTGDRDRFNLPEEVTILHAEFTYYYYPGDTPFPLPAPKFYVQLNPIQIHFDVCSSLWLNAFALNLHQSLLLAHQDQEDPIPYVDVKVEAIMPRMIFDSSTEHPNQRDRPRSLHMQVSRVSITNVRSLEHSSRADLAKCVDTFQLGSLFYGADFPACPSDIHVVTDKFLKHIAATDCVRKGPQLSASSIPDMERSLSREMLWTDAKDVWCISLEPVWGDFMGAPAVGPARPVPFLDAVPLTLWVHVPLTGGPAMNIHALAHVANLVSVQLNHYQYLFLLRLSEQASELATVLVLDSNRILRQEKSGSLVLGATVPQVEVTFVMPSQSPGKECSGGDLESVLPDSVSLQEDNIPNSGIPGIPSAPQGPRRPGVHTPGSEISSLSMDFPPEPVLPLPPIVAFPTIAIPNNLNAGLSSMKKGLSNFMTSLDSALKPGSDDASDTVSLRSDASSDSENYVVVNLSAEGVGDRNAECLDAMFRVAPATTEPLQALEVASEVMVEEEGTATTSPSERSLDSSSKRRDLVSMSTFKLGQVELVQQSQGYSSIVKVQVANLAAEECGAIPWDEFQSKFGCRSRAWLEVPADGGGRARVRVRLTHTVSPRELTDRNSLREWGEDHLEARISDVDLELNMSTIVGLADLAEDEVLPQPLPMQLSLENVHFLLNEDRPPANITSPGSVPIQFAVAHLIVKRGKDGVFCVEPQTRPDTDRSRPISNGVRQLAILEHSNKQLQSENSELKRRLAALERVSEENHLLRQSSEESQILRSCLAVAQDDLAGLLEEKRSLLDRLRGLQEQLDQAQRSKR